MNITLKTYFKKISFCGRIALTSLDIFVTNIILHQLPMIPKKFIQVTLIYYDFSSAEMIAAKDYFLTDASTMIGDECVT